MVPAFASCPLAPSISTCARTVSTSNSTQHPKTTPAPALQTAQARRQSRTSVLAVTALPTNSIPKQHLAFCLQSCKNVPTLSNRNCVTSSNKTPNTTQKKLPLPVPLHLATMCPALQTAPRTAPPKSICTALSRTQPSIPQHTLSRAKTASTSPERSGRMQLESNHAFRH